MYPAISLPTDMSTAHPSTDFQTLHAVNGWSSCGWATGSLTVHPTNTPVTTLSTRSSDAHPVVIDQTGSCSISNESIASPNVSSVILQPSYSLIAITMTDTIMTHLAVNSPSNKLTNNRNSHMTTSLSSLSSIPPSSKCDNMENILYLFDSDEFLFSLCWSNSPKVLTSLLIHLRW